MGGAWPPEALRCHVSLQLRVVPNGQRPKEQLFMLPPPEGKVILKQHFLYGGPWPP